MQGGEGTVIPGDYDQAVKDHILSQIQNIEDEDERAQVLAAWNEYDFESAPRTHIITEVYEITYPEETQSSYTMMPTDWTSTGDVLMGFTWTAPKIDWTIGDKCIIVICLPWPLDDICVDFTVYDYKAGFELDAGLGLRLPTEVTLNNLPEEMIADHDYTLSTSIEGVNWDAAQYSAANVEPVGGNEYVCHLTFFLGVYVKLAGITVVDKYTWIDENFNEDFKTPFGPSEEFPISDLSLSLAAMDWGLASFGLGLNIDSHIGSETITADWSANGDATGIGTVEYNVPSVTEDFGPVHACECSSTEEDANIQLSDFKYYFDKCSFDATANIQLYIAGVKDFSTDLDLFSIDMSDITGGLYLGVHSGTTADGVSTMVPVNQPPIADANGPYEDDEGSPITFDASGSTDPDGDTLQYRWDFDNDGAWDTEWLAIPTASHTWGDDHRGTAKVEVRDVRPTQLTDTDTALVTVNNVAPTASIDSMTQPNPQFILPIVHELAFDGSFADPGWLDTHTSTWNFGDDTLVLGTLTEENEEPDAIGTTTVEHIYSEPGTYTVTLRVTDDDDGFGTDTMPPVTVVDAKAANQDLNDYIQGLDDDDFKNNADQRKNALANMLMAIDAMLAEEAYQGAIQDLRNNVRGKADGYMDGNSKNDWIIDPDAQQHICMKIDDLTAYLEHLKTLEG